MSKDWTRHLCVRRLCELDQETLVKDIVSYVAAARADERAKVLAEVLKHCELHNDKEGETYAIAVNPYELWELLRTP